MASVTLKGATKIFPPDVVAVNKVDIEIPDKEFLVLVDKLPNGRRACVLPFNLSDEKGNQ
jgi:ABC-type phosphate/phosphonate transport system ATPase subunit